MPILWNIKKNNFQKLITEFRKRKWMATSCSGKFQCFVLFFKFFEFIFFYYLILFFSDLLKHQGSYFILILIYIIIYNLYLLKIKFFIVWEFLFPIQCYSFCENYISWLIIYLHGVVFAFDAPCQPYL